MRDAADLDARAVVLQRILELALDRAVVALLLHVDEVDDDQAGEVAQAQLAGDSSAASRLVWSAVSSILCSRVERPEFTSIGDQRLGLVDDDVAARAAA
jgi:hypothetical protein